MYRRIIKGWSILFSSNIIASFLGLAVLALVAKKLTIEEFGVLGIIQSFTITVGTLLNFQTWQTVIKYYPKVKNNPSLVGSLLKYSYILDITTAVVAFIFGLIFLEFFYKIIKIPELYKYCAQIYLFTILTKLNGTATGYLRGVDKYHLFFKSRILAGLVKLALVLPIWWADLGLVYVVVVFAIGESVYDFALNINLFKTLKQNSLGGFYRNNTKLIRDRFKDIFSFSLHSNLISSFDIIVLQADVMIVSAFFGVTYAGCFKMIKVIGNVIGKVSGPVAVTISPIVSELIAEKKLGELKKNLLRSFAYLSSFFSLGFLVFLAIDDFVVKIIFSKEYLDYLYFLDFAMFNLFVSLTFMGIHPVANFLGYHRQILYVIMTLAIFYLLLIYLFSTKVGFEIIFIAQLSQIVLVVLSKLYLSNKKLNFLSLKKPSVL